jgi:hypothetical protein
MLGPACGVARLAGAAAVVKEEEEEEAEVLGRVRLHVWRLHGGEVEGEQASI